MERLFESCAQKFIGVVRKRFDNARFALLRVNVLAKKRGIKMNKILAGLLITGAAVAVGVVAAKVIKSKNSEPDYDDDMFDYPDPYDTDEDISFDLVDELDETDADKLADEAETVEEAAEEAEKTEEEISEDKE